MRTIPLCCRPSRKLLFIAVHRRATAHSSDTSSCLCKHQVSIKHVACRRSLKSQKRDAHSGKATGSSGSAGSAAAAAAAAIAAPGAASERLETWPLIKTLLTSPGFQVGLRNLLALQHVLHAAALLCIVQPGLTAMCNNRVMLAPQAVTWASAMNDVGSWALVAWQATFYQVTVLDGVLMPVRSSTGMLLSRSTVTI